MDDEEEKEPPAPTVDEEAWMLSFGDLVSLMLVFFVMLFAMSTLEQEEFEAIVSALAQQFNPAAEIIRVKPAIDHDVPKISVPKGRSLDYVRALITDKMEEDQVLSQITLHLLHDRLVISLPSDTLFAASTASINPEAERALFLLGGLLGYLSHRIDVNGHTDPDPITTPDFPSNWELSLSRAIAVANALRRAGYDRSIHSFGFADSRFGALSIKLPAPRRYELARRVDVVIRELSTKN